MIEPGWRYTLDEYLNGVIEDQRTTRSGRPVAALDETARD